MSDKKKLSFSGDTDRVILRYTRYCNGEERRILSFLTAKTALRLHAELTDALVALGLIKKF